jgi:hypothetical protein
MNLTKHFIFLLIVVVVSLLGWSGCYTQLATSSDNPEPAVDPPTTDTDQFPPPELYYPHPFYPSPPENNYPHQLHPLPPASTTSTGSGIDTPSPESPHRQSGYQRSPSTDQSNSRQTETTPSRTSWSPAPAQTPRAPTPESGTRTGGSTRGGR